MPELVISLLDKSEVDQAAWVVAKGFLTDPADHIRAVWKGGEAKLLMQNQKLFKLLFELPGKEVYTVKSGSKLVGVYAIQPSHLRHMSIWQQAKMVFPMLKAVGSNLPRLMYWHDEWGSIHPKQAHLHLSPMCVLPGHQGRGIGKMMLRHLCDLLDARSSCGYLETGKWVNVLFYQKYGFALQNEIDIYAAKTWTMWRDPK